MKTIQEQFKHYVVLTLLALVLALPSQAQEQKKISKQYSVSSDTELSIDNRFGLVEIKTWSKNEVTVDITIKVEGRGSRSDKELLDRIDVEIRDSSPKTSLYFKTVIGSNRGWNNNGNFSIDYVVNMPKTMSLDLSNAHGETFVGDIEGYVRLESRHGRARLGKLGKADVDIEFGSASIEGIALGDLQIRHCGRVDVESLGNVEVSSAHSNIDITEAGDLEIEAQHGNVRVDAVADLDADMAHGNLRVGKLANTLLLRSRHGNADIDEVDKDFNRIDMDGEFADFDLNITAGAGFDFDGRFRHGSLKYNRDEFDFPISIKESHESEYRGKVGGEGSARVSVRTSHGSLRLRKI